MMDIEEVAEWGRTLSESLPRLDDVDDAARIDMIRSLEEMKCRLEAAQAELEADFDVSQRAEQAARGVPVERQGRGVAAQIAFARRESHHRGTQHLGLAKILRAELPCTRAAWRAGRITEWRATILARETACLSLADRLLVDLALAGDADRLAQMGERELIAEARKLAYELDPAAIAGRRAKAEKDRRVTIRPAPDVMSSLNALLPVTDGVAVYAALKQTADTLISSGDGRNRGQIMADTLVDRVTGRVPLSGEATPAPQVVIDLVVDDVVLFGDSHAPGHIDGWGPIPADLARDLATEIDAHLRRLYAQPSTGSLVAMDSRTRLFPDALARFIRLRDRFCRNPWCDAPIRHIDHSRDHADGGPTDHLNGQGLCEACSYAKQAHGWRAGPAPGPRHSITTTTPTGHTYRSAAPPIRRARPQSRPARIDIHRIGWTLAYAA